MAADLIGKIKTNRIRRGDLTYFFSQTEIDGKLLDRFQKTSDECGLIDRYEALKGGAIANVSENRRVLHHLLRAEKYSSDVEEYAAFYSQEKKKVYDFADRIRSGKLKSPSGKPYATLVQIGLGGSVLGCRFLCNALAEVAEARSAKRLGAEFFSNIDRQWVRMKLNSFDIDTTLFVLVSKSGKTYETELIKNWVDEYVKGRNGGDFRKQTVAITSKSSPLAADDGYVAKFYMDDYIGGRYSISSACALLLNASVYGSEMCEEFLRGMEEMDNVSLVKSVRENPVLLASLYSVYENREKSKNVSFCLPYAEGLEYFPSHLAQLSMESNGKDKDMQGGKLAGISGQFLFGDRGTCAQHSFFQQLHQGTFPFSAEFIGYKDKPELLSSMVAQSAAMYLGDKEKGFDGGRTNTVLLFDKYNAFSLGELVSFYENKTMFQGFLYNINSFDQPGVELGKVMLKKILTGADESLASIYKEMLK